MDFAVNPEYDDCMSEIISLTFNLPVATVRSFYDDGGQLWFVAKDVCAAISIENSRNATARLDPADVRVHPMDTNAGSRDMTVVSEPGMYELVIRSDKPNARPFIRWITHEVLPSLRRTGTYTMPGRSANAERRRTRWGWQPIREIVRAAGYSTRTFTSSANALVIDGVGTFTARNYDTWTYGGCLPAESLVVRAERLLGRSRVELFTADVLASYRDRGPGNHRRAGGNPDASCRSSRRPSSRRPS